ncbi:hypothetical protein BgiMline_018667, partial [Biomphalaria glabrata]
DRDKAVLCLLTDPTNCRGQQIHRIDVIKGLKHEYHYIGTADRLPSSSRQPSSSHFHFWTSGISA